MYFLLFLRSYLAASLCSLPLWLTLDFGPASDSLEFSLFWLSSLYDALSKNCALFPAFSCGFSQLPFLWRRRGRECLSCCGLVGCDTLLAALAIFLQRRPSTLSFCSDYFSFLSVCVNINSILGCISKVNFVSNGVHRTRTLRSMLLIACSNFGRRCM